MSWSKSSKERERYYLFAGMGGAASRRKKTAFLIWSLVAAAFASAALGLIFFYMDRIKVG